MTLPAHLYGFQAEDAAALVGGGVNRLLLLPMGAGKSVIAIAAAEELDPFTIVVICPAIVRADWHAKFSRFARQNYARDPNAAGRRVLVLSYEQVNTPMRRASLLAFLQRIDVLILDEGQRLKNPDAHVVQSIYGEHAQGTGLATLARHTWVASGTIAPNHWGELYTHVRALFPKLLPVLRGAPMRYWDFIDRYCVWEPTRHGYKVVGNKRQDELRQMLHGIAIRRDKSEVDKLLPALTVDTIELPEDELDQAAYDELMCSPAGMALKEAVTMELIWQRTPHLSAARRILGELKAPAVARYVRALLEGDAEARILVFMHHRAAMARVANDISDIEPLVRVIDGETTEADRDTAVRRFQDGDMRVLILGIGTAREGITLTAANRVVMGEAAWTPGQNEQCIKRAHRIGQTRPVFAEFLCIHNTLDQAVMSVCVRKSELLSEIN